MRSSTAPVKVAFLVLVVISEASAQDSLSSVQQNAVLTGFVQNINTLSWLGNAGKDWTADDYSVSLDENFHSVLIKGQQDLIRDEQDFGSELRRRISGNLFGFVNLSSNYVSDSRQLGLNSVGATIVTGGLNYADAQDSLRGAAGNKWDQQAGVNNSGFTYNFQGATTFSPSENAELNPSFLLNDEQISPRRNYDRDIRIGYVQSFSPLSSLMFVGTYYSQRRDFYFPADQAVEELFKVTNNIQSRNDNRTAFQAGLSSPIWLFEVTANSSYGQRAIISAYRYKAPQDTINGLNDTRITVSDFDFNGNVSAGTANDSLIVAFIHSERTETHSYTVLRDSSQAQLNNIGKTNTLNAKVVLHMGTLSANLLGLASLFRYDTPSTLNYDDRDELTNTLAFEIDNRFTPFLTAGIGAEADMIHVVYITSQRSANNDRNFIYKLFPVVTYSDSRIRSYNKFEVLANYTVYDYEAFSQIHSFSFRQASFLDSTSAVLGSRLTASLLTNVKLYTRGELYWSSFSEYPLNYFVDQTYWLSFFYSKGVLKYGVGYKYLSLTQYNYATSNEKVFALRQTNSGPTASFSVSMSKVQVLLTGWYQVSRQSLQNPIVYPNFEIKATYII